LWIQNPVYEIKAESTNDRLSGTARNPRFQERVPAGSAFQAEMLLKVFEGDNGDKMAKELEHALGVLQQFDALGAGGSRGSGRIKIRNFARETIAIAGVTLAA
jgi:CRISPR-associated protein Csm3